MISGMTQRLCYNPSMSKPESKPRTYTQEDYDRVCEERDTAQKEVARLHELLRISEQITDEWTTDARKMHVWTTAHMQDDKATRRMAALVQVLETRAAAILLLREEIAELKRK